MWDNRATAHRAIPGKYTQTRRGIRTTVFGTKPKLDPGIENRDERAEKLRQTESHKLEGQEGVFTVPA